MKILSQLLQWIAKLLGFPPQPDRLEKPAGEQPSPTLIVSNDLEAERICEQITQFAESIASLMRDNRQNMGQQVTTCQQLVSKLECLLQE
jgi:hypothetical protein